MLYQGTMVTRKPTRAHTLRLVNVLTTISTMPVNARPIRECTVSMRRIDRQKYMTKSIYAVYVNTESTTARLLVERFFSYCEHRR